MQGCDPLHRRRFTVFKRAETVAHLDADHQAKPTNLADGHRIFLSQLGQFIDKKLAKLAGVGSQVVTIDDLENLVRDRAGQRIAAERRAVSAGAKHFGVLLRNPHSAHWETAAESLGHADGIRQEIANLVAEYRLKTLERPGAKMPALHTVPQQQQIVFAAKCAQAKQVFRRRWMDATLALDALNHHRHRGRCDRRAHGVDVIVRHMCEAL